ncbi:hypothetical protein [Pseudoduganella namucuonensis]|uniref:Uncharacterized protein n=1 Tax=Pseudoduganella namucuonensis TaxID=1035707 RepID=A0A1I7L681_9BURK|nr:hypothetical protein [Pseudoduganella namucuonensis]SFV05148.1 hypothetical protein SAMN05216552_1023106 [Pseudoduganella namucuonensis]
MSPAKNVAKKQPSAPLPWWLREFSQVRTALLVFLVVLACSVSAVVLSRWALHEAQASQTRAQQLRNEARQRYVNVETEKLEIATYQPLFAILRERGLIGQENRLEWVEAIRQVQEQRRLLPISYEIAPQQPVVMEPALDLGGYSMRGSRMKLHMDLLHEGDLFSLLSDLRARTHFTVQECAIKRAAGAGNPVAAPDAPLAPALSADCTLNWLTLTPTAAQAAPPMGTRP